MNQRIELIILPFFHQRRQFGSAEAGLQAGGFVHRQDWGRCLARMFHKPSDPAEL